MGRKKYISLIFLTTITLFISSASALEKGDWIIRGGLTNINPISDNGEVVNVDDKSNVTATFSYLVTDNWFRSYSRTPFEHDILIKLWTGLKIASAQHFHQLLLCNIT